MCWVEVVTQERTPDSSIGLVVRAWCLVGAWCLAVGWWFIIVYVVI